MRLSSTTPSIVVEATRTNLVGNVRRTNSRRIYGGVSLSAPNKAVHVDTASPEADAVAQALRAVINTVPPLTPVRFECEGRPHRAVALPGAATQDVGVCGL